MSSALQVHGLPGKRRAYAAKSSSAPQLTMIRIGNVVTVTALTFLVGSPVYYHWYLDGVHVGSGTSPSFSFSVEQAGQGRVEVVDTLDPNFDPLSPTIAQFPARYTVHWVRNILDSDVRGYLVQHLKNGVTLTTLATIPHDSEAWDYRVLSDRLADRAVYKFQVTPLDAAGNAGTTLSVEEQDVIRSPDAPNWNFTYDPATDRVAFAAV